MNCINCGIDKGVSILKGLFICDKCNELNYIDYYRCENCGETWKVVDMDLGIVERVNLEQSSNEFEEEDSSYFGELHPAKTMMGYIHRCLLCNSISYEKDENTWHCSKCGFEWEVIGCA